MWSGRTASYSPGVSLQTARQARVIPPQVTAGGHDTQTALPSPSCLRRCCLPRTLHQQGDVFVTGTGGSQHLPSGNFTRTKFRAENSSWETAVRKEPGEAALDGRAPVGRWRKQESEAHGGAALTPWKDGGEASSEMERAFLFVPGDGLPGINPLLPSSRSEEGLPQHCPSVQRQHSPPCPMTRILATDTLGSWAKAGAARLSS